MQILGLIWGILAVMVMFIALIPLLGWLNWGNIHFAVIGLIISIIATINARGSQRMGIAGIVLNCIAIVWGAIRLQAGGGFI